MKDIKSMTLAELGAELKVLGEPAFRAKQIYRWMHRGVRDFSEMTDISRSLRERLAAEYTLVSPTVARRLQSQKDGTIKYLWRLMDGNCVESVLMRYHYGNTICISSEVGCRMGCAFCASTRGGLVRPPRARRKCWIRCCFRSWIPACPSRTSCSWASASPAG